MKKQIVLSLMLVTLVQGMAFAAPHPHLAREAARVARESGRTPEEARRAVTEAFRRSNELTPAERAEILGRNGDRITPELAARAARVLENARPEVLRELSTARGALGTEASREAGQAPVRRTAIPEGAAEAPVRERAATAERSVAREIAAALNTARGRVRSGQLSQAGFAKLRRATLEVSRSVSEQFRQGQAQGFNRAEMNAKIAEMIKVLSENVDPTTKEPLFFVAEGGKACEGFTVEAIKNLSEFMVEANARAGGRGVNEFLTEMAKSMGRKFNQTDAQGVERLKATAEAGCLKAGSPAMAAIMLLAGTAAAGAAGSAPATH